MDTTNPVSYRCVAFVCLWLFLASHPHEVTAFDVAKLPSPVTPAHFTSQRAFVFSHGSGPPLSRKIALMARSRTGGGGGGGGKRRNGDFRRSRNGNDIDDLSLEEAYNFASNTDGAIRYQHPPRPATSDDGIKKNKNQMKKTDPILPTTTSVGSVSASDELAVKDDENEKENVTKPTNQIAKAAVKTRTTTQQQQKQQATSYASLSKFQKAPTKVPPSPPSSSVSTPGTTATTITSSSDDGVWNPKLTKTKTTSTSTSTTRRPSSSYGSLASLGSKRETGPPHVSKVATSTSSTSFVTALNSKVVVGGAKKKGGDNDGTVAVKKSTASNDETTLTTTFPVGADTTGDGTDKEDAKVANKEDMNATATKVPSAPTTTSNMPVVAANPNRRREQKRTTSASSYSTLASTSGRGKTASVRPPAVQGLIKEMTEKTWNVKGSESIPATTTPARFQASPTKESESASDVETISSVSIINDDDQGSMGDDTTTTMAETPLPATAAAAAAAAVDTPATMYTATKTESLSLDVSVDSIKESKIKTMSQEPSYASLTSPISSDQALKIPPLLERTVDSRNSSTEEVGEEEDETPVAELEATTPSDVYVSLSSEPGMDDLNGRDGGWTVEEPNPSNELLTDESMMIEVEPVAAEMTDLVPEPSSLPTDEVTEKDDTVEGETNVVVDENTSNVLLEPTSAVEDALPSAVEDALPSAGNAFNNSQFLQEVNDGSEEGDNKDWPEGLATLSNDSEEEEYIAANEMAEKIQLPSQAKRQLSFYEVLSTKQRGKQEEKKKLDRNGFTITSYNEATDPITATVATPPRKLQVFDQNVEKENNNSVPGAPLPKDSLPSPAIELFEGSGDLEFLEEEIEESSTPTEEELLTEMQILQAEIDENKETDNVPWLEIPPQSSNDPENEAVTATVPDEEFQVPSTAKSQQSFYGIVTSQPAGKHDKEKKMDRNGFTITSYNEATDPITATVATPPRKLQVFEQHVEKEAKYSLLGTLLSGDTVSKQKDSFPSPTLKRFERLKELDLLEKQVDTDTSPKLKRFERHNGVEFTGKQIVSEGFSDDNEEKDGPPTPKLKVFARFVDQSEGTAGDVDFAKEVVEPLTSDLAEFAALDLDEERVPATNEDFFFLDSAKDETLLPEFTTSETSPPATDKTAVEQTVTDRIMTNFPSRRFMGKAEVMAAAAFASGAVSSTQPLSIDAPFQIQPKNRPVSFVVSRSQETQVIRGPQPRRVAIEDNADLPATDAALRFYKRTS